MELWIEYTLMDDKVTIISCKGYGNVVVIPSSIKGKPVTKLGAYAFSDCKKSKEFLPLETKLYNEVIPGATVPGCTLEYIGGRNLKEIYLPETLEVLDEYAFYDCRELEILHICSGKIEFQNGVFMNCEKLREVNIKGNPDQITCVSEILSEKSDEVYVHFISGEGKGVFLFPEFYEDSIENTPARIFHYLIYGAGYRYRQCFSQGRLNILAYDTVFKAAEIKNIHETALKIAFLRLRYPYQLQETMRDNYLNYIKTHVGAAIDFIISNDKIENMIFLTSLNCMTDENYTKALTKVTTQGKKEWASMLLKEKLHYFPPKEKSFDL